MITEIDALRDVHGIAFEPVHDRGAHWARPLHFRAEHEAVREGVSPCPKSCDSLTLPSAPSKT
jgi:hypothetical protein